MKPAIVTQNILWEKLDSIEKMLQAGKHQRLFKGLLINDIVKDLKVTADFVLREWILTGKLKAVKVGGEGRLRGGWRISLFDYVEFLKTLESNLSPEEERIIFVKSPKQIIEEFSKSNKRVA
ncbi:MAG: hypothetical protein KGZ42_07295 [Melioribacter sp.]|nr:hypothetical protein [Melioribacter sp.]